MPLDKDELIIKVAEIMTRWREAKRIQDDADATMLDLLDKAFSELLEGGE